MNRFKDYLLIFVFVGCALLSHLIIAMFLSGYMYHVIMNILGILMVCVAAYIKTFLL